MRHATPGREKEPEAEVSIMACPPLIARETYQGDNLVGRLLKPQ